MRFMFPGPLIKRPTTQTRLHRARAWYACACAVNYLVSRLPCSLARLTPLSREAKLQTNQRRLSVIPRSTSKTMALKDNLGGKGQKPSWPGRLSWRNVTASAGAQFSCVSRSLCAVVGPGPATRGTEYLPLFSCAQGAPKATCSWFGIWMVWSSDFYSSFLCLTYVYISVDPKRMYAFAIIYVLYITSILSRAMTWTLNFELCVRVYMQLFATARPAMPCIRLVLSAV